MRNNPYAKYIGLITLLAVSALSGCSHQHLAKNSHAALTAAHSLQQATERPVQQQLKQAQTKIAADNKEIPSLLAQSDASLKQAQNLQKQAAAVKIAKARQPIQDKAKKAQDAADSKAQQLVTVRQDLYAQLGAVADLQKKISGLHTEDHTASQVAASQDDGTSRHQEGKHTRQVAQQGQQSHM